MRTFHDHTSCFRRRKGCDKTRYRYRYRNMSVRYRYDTVSVLYRILRVGIGIIPIPYRTDIENAKKWIPIGIGIGTGSVRDRYGIGIRRHMLIPSALLLVDFLVCHSQVFNHSLHP
ncbi:hypothetical protein HanXRQr2_Chr04g0160621 [Helianthus annuus]|uniref:Uncharacterized protein n=1 Tax=Helianthus annuus TaxID=4232 RepID=A0A9K3J7D9_HELAN|nr:hypothetical protein HanXRQr2_Chr04g0160621 [Helianthus annuus]KAJ0930882.1 hypothetical protein HanPSC8_Chr04g0154701 [Helianthus annuus]